MGNRGSMFILTPLVLFFSLSAYASSETKMISLTDPKHIADVTALQEAVDRVSAKVTECVDKKLAPQQKCFCLYPTEWRSLKDTYENTLKNNPGWQNGNVSWSAKGMGHAVSFSGLRRQLEIKCE